MTAKLVPADPSPGRVIVIRADAAHLPLSDASADVVVTDPPSGTCPARPHPAGRGQRGDRGYGPLVP
jgi:hypothetical protein